MRAASIEIVVILSLLFVTSCSIVEKYTGEGENEHIRKTGSPASAEVIEIWDTGIRFNNNPVVGFRLVVTLADGTFCEAKTKNLVSVVHIPQVQPGAILPVKVHQKNCKLVALDIFEEDNLKPEPEK